MFSVLHNNVYCCVLKGQQIPDMKITAGFTSDRPDLHASLTRRTKSDKLQRVVL